MKENRNTTPPLRPSIPDLVEDAANLMRYGGDNVEMPGFRKEERVEHDCHHQHVGHWGVITV
jgi:hypothetical protein